MAGSGQEQLSFGGSRWRVWASVCFCLAAHSRTITSLEIRSLPRGSRARRVARPDSAQPLARPALLAERAAIQRVAARRAAEQPAPVRRASVQPARMSQAAGQRAAMPGTAAEQANPRRAIPRPVARARRVVHRRAQAAQAPTRSFNRSATRRSSRGAPATRRAFKFVTGGVGQTASATNQRPANSDPTWSSRGAASRLPRTTPVTRSRRACPRSARERCPARLRSVRFPPVLPALVAT